MGVDRLPAKKMRVELFDSEGNRYTVAFEGQITRDKALRLLDLVELLGGMPNEAVNNGTEPSQNPNAILAIRKSQISNPEKLPISMVLLPRRPINLRTRNERTDKPQHRVNLPIKTSNKGIPSEDRRRQQPKVQNSSENCSDHDSPQAK